MIDLSHALAILGGIASTIAIYEACGRGMRAMAKKFGEHVARAVSVQLPSVAISTLNGRYPLAKDVNPRLERIEAVVKLLESLIKRLPNQMQYAVDNPADKT